jgi:SpoVK/Ycf46/Vps4 family AAA+-type ATPase
MQVGLPDEAARAAILRRLFAHAPKAPGVEPARRAAATAGMTPADLAHLSHTALGAALRRDVAADAVAERGEASGSAVAAVLTDADLEGALALARRSVRFLAALEACRIRCCGKCMHLLRRLQTKTFLSMDDASSSTTFHDRVSYTVSCCNQRELCR